MDILLSYIIITKGNFHSRTSVLTFSPLMSAGSFRSISCTVNSTVVMNSFTKKSFSPAMRVWILCWAPLSLTLSNTTHNTLSVQTAGRFKEWGTRGCKVPGRTEPKAVYAFLPLQDGCNGLNKILLDSFQRNNRSHWYLNDTCHNTWCRSRPLVYYRSSASLKELLLGANTVASCVPVDESLSPVLIASSASLHFTLAPFSLQLSTGEGNIFFSWAIFWQFVELDLFASMKS